MSPHIETFTWFRANQSSFFHVNAASFVEKQQIPILYFIVFGLTQSGLEPTIYLTRGEHANLIPLMQFRPFGILATIFRIQPKVLV